jgi:hypothetical protein
MRRLCTEPPFTCASCEVQIAGRPVFHVGLPFCCAGCVAGGPCLCTYEEDPGDDHRGDHRRIDDPTRAPVAHDPRSLAGAAR